MQSADSYCHVWNGVKAMMGVQSKEINSKEKKRKTVHLQNCATDWAKVCKPFYSIGKGKTVAKMVCADHLVDLCQRTSKVTPLHIPKSVNCGTNFSCYKAIS